MLKQGQRGMNCPGDGAQRRAFATRLEMPLREPPDTLTVARSSGQMFDRGHAAQAIRQAAQQS